MGPPPSPGPPSSQGPGATPKDSPRPQRPSRTPPQYGMMAVRGPSLPPAARGTPLAHPAAGEGPRARPEASHGPAQPLPTQAPPPTCSPSRAGPQGSQTVPPSSGQSRSLQVDRPKGEAARAQPEGSRPGPRPLLAQPQTPSPHKGESSPPSQAPPTWPRAMGPAQAAPQLIKAKEPHPLNGTPAQPGLTAPQPEKHAGNHRDPPPSQWPRPLRCRRPAGGRAPPRSRPPRAPQQRGSPPGGFPPRPLHEPG
jgi:hypothetical protein